MEQWFPKLFRTSRQIHGSVDHRRVVLAHSRCSHFVSLEMNRTDTNNNHNRGIKAGSVESGKTNGASRTTRRKLLDLLEASQKETRKLRRELAVLKADKEETNDHHRKEKRTLMVEVERGLDLLDYGEILTIASDRVWLSHCLEKAGIPAADVPKINTFFHFDAYIRGQPDGLAMYRKLPAGIKKLGGPGCFGVLLIRMKRERNLEVHSERPVDVNASILCLKNKFFNDETIPSEVKQLVRDTMPELMLQIQAKKAEDEEDRCTFDTRMQQLQTRYARRMEAFLQCQPEQSPSNGSHGHVSARKHAARGELGGVRSD